MKREQHVEESKRLERTEKYGCNARLTILFNRMATATAKEKTKIEIHTNLCVFIIYYVHTYTGHTLSTSTFASAALNMKIHNK